MSDTPSFADRIISASNVRICLFLSILLSFFSGYSGYSGYSAHAQTTEQTTTQQTTTDYALTESYGLLGAKDKGSFGNGMYSGTKRSQLTALLKLTEQSQWVSMRPLVKNYLLTKADSSVLTQDTPITTGEDLLTLRLNALLRMGYNREAFELYRKASDNELDEPTIRAGVYAMLFNRQKGLACLDIKTVATQYKDMPVWTALNIYCEESITGDNAKIDGKELSKYPVIKALLKSPDYKYEYNPKDFAALSILERAILSAQGAIATNYISQETISEIPPNHIAILLAQPNISNLQKALLLCAAINYAIEEPKTLTSYYKEILDQYTKNGKEPVSSNTQDLLTLARLYKETKNSWQGKERAEKISQAIKLANKYSDKLLIPFLPVISKLDIDKEISLKNCLSIAHLYLYAPDTISKKWIKYLLKNNSASQESEKITRENLLISLFLLHKNNDDAISNKVYKHISTTPLHSSFAKDVKNIIENIDSTPTNSDKVRVKDTNSFDLVIGKGYKMPSYRVLSTLKQAGDNQDISVSLLLSNCILSKIDRQSMYIGTLGNIMSALNKIGIKIVPRHIIAQALIQIEN